jgi:predicted dehydrogenase
MNEGVRIGIIGCGSVVRRPYMTIISKLRLQGHAEVTIACDNDEARGRLMEEEFGISRFTTDYRQVVSDDEVDLVLIATPMTSHAPMAMAALEAGKHVLVEKPMGVSLEEGQQLVEAARKAPGYLVPAPHVILSPTYQEIWRHLQRGAIGEVHLARGRYGWAGPYWSEWYYRSGGGPLFDLGVYNLTSLTGWLGPARRVTAMMGTAIEERDINGRRVSIQADDNFQILIDFGNACFAAITTGFTIQKYRGPALELYGTTGTLQMMGNDWAPDGFELWQNDVGAWQLFGELDASWRWTDGLRHLVACIREGRKPLITPEHAYHVLEIMIKAMEAGKDGRTREIESTFTPPTFPLHVERAPAHYRHDRSH